MQTCFGMLEMEDFVILSIFRLLALEIRSDSVKVKVIAAVIQRGGFAINVTPIGAYLSFLIERSAIRAKESEVLDLK